MGEIHANYLVLPHTNKNIEDICYDDKHTNIDTSATQLGKFLDSVDLWT
jgi:hypothetical protein